MERTVIKINKLSIHMNQMPTLSVPLGMGIMRGAMTELKSTPQIGERWLEEGGVVAGYMPGQDGQPGYYLIVPDDAEAAAKDLAWGNHGHEYKGISSWDGAANTRLLTESGNDHPAATFCVGLRLHGKDDWYLPARREASLATATVPHLFDEGWHWTSTQSSAYLAVGQWFVDGSQDYTSKSNQGRMRAVRRVIA